MDDTVREVTKIAMEIVTQFRDWLSSPEKIAENLEQVKVAVKTLLKDSLGRKQKEADEYKVQNYDVNEKTK